MLPTVTISARAAEKVRGGYPWVFDRDVVRGEAEGDVVRVVSRGRDLGTALYAAGSRLPLRMLGEGALTLSSDFFRARIQAAFDFRRQLFANADAYRVVHGEADRLPGLIIDRYGDVAVMQTLTRAMDVRKRDIAEVAAQVLSVRLVVARDDSSARDFESLTRERAILYGKGATTVTYHDAGNQMEVDVLEDGKTGGFLDQVENHRRAADYAHGDALDAFTYHGGFALALAHKTRSVVALDESESAVSRARANAARNHLTNVSVERKNAFDALRAFESERRSFDLVVIDPPALAKRKSALGSAERAYKELNLRALRILRPGGILVTCSCSGKLTVDRFHAILQSAAHDVGRSIQVLERLGPSRDHAPLLGVPETDYLKCWILRVLP